uniref:Uncharacterized protein n=1 Tax=Strongyloides papillosus TaxID=174720 RepID=A0A0N5BQZ6_STREA
MKFSYLLLTLCLVILQLHISTIECNGLKSIGEAQEGAMETHPVFKRSSLQKLGRRFRIGPRRSIMKERRIPLFKRD